MRPAVSGLARMAVSPVAALAVYALVRPLSETAGLAAGCVVMLGLALAGGPASARDEAVLARDEKVA